MTRPGWSPLEPSIEAALLHVLRDVEDGHVGLWGSPGDISADRVVSARLNGIDWPQLMIERGWVAWVRGGRRCLQITPAGRTALGLD